ncbi:hypothetical protein KXX32_001497 [Aspergillus fumigatus]|nr:hypothetical protein KXX32_001497 [Aspergillus fumigatus]
MRIRMCFDDVAWERSEAIQDAWIHELFKEETLMAIAGALNVSFRMKFEDGGSPIIRFPKPGATMFPKEKLRNEVAIIRDSPALEVAKGERNFSISVILLQYAGRSSPRASHTNGTMPSIDLGQEDKE